MYKKFISILIVFSLNVLTVHAITPLTFEERNSDVPVTVDGHLLQTPFGPGTPSASYPTLVDLDGDNDLDLCIGTGEGTIMYYENTGSTVVPKYVLREKKFLGIDKDEYVIFPTFGDTDKDGDIDMYYGDYSEGITFYKNKGSATKHNLVSSSGSESAVDVKNMATPTFGDIDGDEDLDLFVGNFDGSVHYYENVSHSTTPLFVLTDSTYLDINEKELTIPTLVDIDADADLDLFVSNASGNIRMYLNEGTHQKAKFNTVGEIFLTLEEGYTYASFGDLDGDTDYDLFVGNNKGKTMYFENVGTRKEPEFKKVSDEYFFINLGSFAHVDFADLDNDNDQDIYFISIDGGVKEFTNLGNAKSPRYEYRNLQLIENETYAYAFKFSDLDDDKDKDLIIGHYDRETGENGGGLTYYKNIGSVRSPNFQKVPNFFENIDVGEASAPETLDYDRDGDLDLFVGNEAGKVFYYINNGTTKDAVFSLVSENFEEIDVLGNAQLKFADIDNDDDSDMIVGNKFGRIFYYENVVGNISKNFLNRGELTEDIGDFASVASYDMDQDGKTDIFATSKAGNLYHFRQTSTNLFAPEDVSNVKLTMDNNNILTLSWKPSIDSERDLKHYKLYQQKNDEGFKGGSELHKDTRQATIVDLAEGATYEFKITAVDTSGLESKGVSIEAVRTGGDLDITYDYPIAEVEIIPLPAPEEFCSGFIDVKKELISTDLCDAITYVKKEKIFTGNTDGTLALDRAINRAEVTKVLLVAFKYALEMNTDSLTFTDTYSTEWYAPYIVTAKKHNIIEGYPDNTFHPEKTVNKVELLKLILEMAHTDFSKTDIGNSLATDIVANEANEWFIKYTNYAIENQLIALINGELRPDAPMTRRDVIEMLHTMKSKGLGGL